MITPPIFSLTKEELFKHIYNTKTTLSLKDVMLVPQYSEIASRSIPNLETNLTNNLKKSIPIVSSNMKCTTEFSMLLAMNRIGGSGFLHRFFTVEEFEQQLSDFVYFQDDHTNKYSCIVSVGVKPEEEKFFPIIEKYISLGYIEAILIDIAHGYSKMVFDTIKKLRTVFGESIDIIAGNVATGSAYIDLCEAGVNAVRVGIGGSPVCQTKLVTGSGLPLLTSILDCSQYYNHYKIPIIADGGIKTGADVAKCIAAGAHSVCLGTSLGATSCSPAKSIYNNYGYSSTITHKLVYGMSSHIINSERARTDGFVPANEGKELMLPYLGSTQDYVTEKANGLRSALTYTGVDNIQDFQNKALFAIISENSSRESGYV
jgi:IMP dehydrogenase